MENEEYKSQEYDKNLKVSEDELINTYQQYFDHNAAIKLLVKLRKATRNNPKIISGTAGAIPGIGFADDLASTAAVVAAVGIYSDF